MIWGQRLREQRERAGLTLGQAAEYEQVGRQYLSKLELGTNEPPTWDLLARLVRRYRTSADYILAVTDNPLPNTGEPLSETVQEVVELMADLSPARQAELLAHAQVLAEAERAQDLRDYDRMMSLILAVGGDALADEVEEMLRAGAAGDPAAALRLLDEIVARWRDRLPAQTEPGQEAVEQG